jgi:hypothetical protein
LLLRELRQPTLLRVDEALHERIPGPSLADLQCLLARGGGRFVGFIHLDVEDFEQVLLGRHGGVAGRDHDCQQPQQRPQPGRPPPRARNDHETA